MSVSVHYPDGWIGIPDFGAGEVFETPRAWAQALVVELVEGSSIPLEPSEQEALVGALALVATGVAERGARASYVHLRTLRGPLELVDLALVPRAAVGDAPAAEVAGALDPDAVRPPTVTELRTATGLRGALVIRHAPLDADAPHILTLRASAALDVGDGFAVLGTATTELAAFEAFRPSFMALIESVSVDS